MHDASQRPKVGISRCLLGEPVRYDGGHKLDRYLRDTLGRFVDFVPVCPEVECGLSVPREAMRLVGDPAGPRLLGSRTGEDFTPRMRAWLPPRLEALALEDLCGFIFKCDSPSSGMVRVKVYPEPRPDGKPGGPASRSGRGIFAAAFMDRFPLLPVEDDGRLHDPDIRENFIERLFVFHRWRALQESDAGVSGLLDFHARHKLLVMAHSPVHLRRLGRIAAEAKARPQTVVRAEYLAALTEALRLKATPKKHRNVLDHAMGYFKRQLGPDEKKELLELTSRYAEGQLPLIVPVTLINHYVRKFGQPYLASQHYLLPHPAELGLRNHV